MPRLGRYFQENKPSSWVKQRIQDEAGQLLARDMVDALEAIRQFGLILRAIGEDFGDAIESRARESRSTIKIVYKHCSGCSACLGRYPTHVEVSEYRGKGKIKTIKFKELHPFLSNKYANPTQTSDYLWILSLENAVWQVWGRLNVVLDELEAIEPEEGELKS